MSDACSKKVQDIELASDPSLNNLEKKFSELNQCLNRVERKEYLYQINECYKFIINQFCLVSKIKLSYFYKSIKNEQQQTLNDFKPKKYFNRDDYSNENIFNTIKVKPMHKLFMAFLNSRSLTDQNFISIQLYIDHRHESFYDLTPKDFKDQLDKYGEFIDYFKTDDGFFVSTYKAIISVSKKLVDEILALEDSVTNHIASNLKD